MFVCGCVWRGWGNGGKIDHSNDCWGKPNPARRQSHLVAYNYSLQNQGYIYRIASNLMDISNYPDTILN